MKTICTNSTHWLDSFDFFALKPSYRITFKNQDVYSTFAGKFLTIVLFVCCFGSFFYFGINMIFRKNPKTIISENYREIPDYLNITKENLFLSFGMQNFQGDFIIDEGIYIPKMSVIKRNKTNIIGEISVDLAPCQNSDIPENPDLTNYFQINPINGMYCIANYYPLEMQGSLDSNFFEFTKFWIEACDNVTMKGTCKSTSDIINFFNTNTFYMTYAPSAVDTLNYNRPFNQHGAFYEIMTNYETKTSIFFDFQSIQIVTDDGIIIESQQVQRILNKNDDKVFFFTRVDGDPLVELFIQSGNIRKTYERVYDKIQDVLAQTGGAIKILMIFFAFIAKPIVQFNFYKDLGNEYFEYEYEEKNRINNEPLKLNLFQYFYSVFKSNASDLVRKSKLFDKSKQILNNSLSLTQLLNKIVELEKLKFLILDPDQIVLFEYIPKPVLSEILNEKKVAYDKHNKINEIRRKTNQEWNENFFEQASPRKKNAKLAYQNIIKKNEKSHLDNRILNLAHFASSQYWTHKFGKTDISTNTLKDQLEMKDVEYDGIKKYNEPPEVVNNFKEILSKSFQEMKLELKNFNSPTDLFINTEGIVKDLESIRK